MRPAGPAVPLPLSAREPVLSNEKARGGDPGPRYVSLSLPVVRSCCSRSRGARVSYQIDAGPGRGMFPVGGDIPGTPKPSASSRVYRVPLFGARGRARAAVSGGAKGWLALGGGPGACSVRSPAGPTVGQGPEDQHGRSAARGAGETSASLA